MAGFASVSWGNGVFAKAKENGRRGFIGVLLRHQRLSRTPRFPKAREIAVDFGRPYWN